MAVELPAGCKPATAPRRPSAAAAPDQGPPEGGGAARLARHRARRAGVLAPARGRDRGAVAGDGQAAVARARRSPTACSAELAATVEAYDSLNAGGVDYAREVLERALGKERADEIIGRLSSVIEKRPFEFLRRTPPEQVVTFLRNESPQTIGAGDRQPPHHARRPGARPACPRPSSPRSRCGSRAWARPAPTSSARSRPSCARSSPTSSSRSTRPPAASSRWPTSSTTPTARPSATCSTRSPRPTRSSAPRSGACCSSSRTSPSSTTARSS